MSHENGIGQMDESMLSVDQRLDRAKDRLKDELDRYIWRRMEQYTGPILFDAAMDGPFELYSSFRFAAQDFGAAFALGRTEKERITHEEVSGGRWRVIDPIYENAAWMLGEDLEKTRLAGNIGWQALQDFRADQVAKDQG